MEKSFFDTPSKSPEKINQETLSNLEKKRHEAWSEFAAESAKVGEEMKANNQDKLTDDQQNRLKTLMEKHTEAYNKWSQLKMEDLEQKHWEKLDDLNKDFSS